MIFPRLYAAVIGSAVLCAASAYAGHTWTDRKWSAKWAKAELAQVKAREAEQAKSLLAERAWHDRVTAAEVANQKDRDALQAALNRSNATASKLRDSIAANAASIPSEAAQSTTSDRSAACWAILGEADGLAGELAEAAERHAGEVRLLLGSWPR